jgi:hypothetical protein
MATKANISIDQGTTFSTQIDLTDENNDPIDLSAYTANAEIRRWYSSTDPAAIFVANTGTNTAAGVLTLTLSANQTSNLEYGRYVYDVRLADASNTITRIVEGIVTVTPSVTR